MNRDRDPDQAALDELSRAFAERDESGADSPDERPVIRIGDGYGVSGFDDADDVDLEPTAPTPIPPDPGFSSRSNPTEGDEDEGSPRVQSSSSEPAVISIDDDELPDAVYVEGDLQGERSGPIVVIDDDESGEVLHTESAGELRRGIEPRLRDRRRAIQRAAGRRRLLIVGGVVAVLVLIVAALAVLGSGLFAVKAQNIALSGVRYTDRQELQMVLDDLVGTPTLLARPGDIETQLSAIPWVERAEVSVDFPSSARVEIVERVPLTTYQGADGRFRIFDREGRVLDIIDGFPIEFVWITSADQIDLELGEFAPTGFVGASELVQNLTPTVRRRIDRIDVTADGSRLRMFLDDGTEVNFGAATALFEKLVRLETLLNQYPDLVDAQLDVSTPETSRASRPNIASPPGSDDDS